METLFYFLFLLLSLVILDTQHWGKSGTSSVTALTWILCLGNLSLWQFWKSSIPLVYRRRLKRDSFPFLSNHQRPWQTHLGNWLTVCWMIHPHQLVRWFQQLLRRFFCWCLSWISFYFDLVEGKKKTPPFLFSLTFDFVSGSWTFILSVWWFWEHQRWLSFSEP